MEWLVNHNSICLIKYFTGNECAGCGMTRAIFSAIHLQFENAYNFNKLFLIILPLLIFIWAKTLFTLWPGKIPSLFNQGKG
jgi:hypothetical protein